MEEYRYNIPILTKEIEQKINSFTYNPLISIIIIGKNVKKTITSIKKQWYKKWEIIIKNNLNEINNIRGDYFSILYEEDELSIDALYEVVKILNIKQYDLIYSDEDFIDKNGNYIDPYFKPDFSPDMLLSQNYINNLVVIKKELFNKYNTSKYNTRYELYLEALNHDVFHIPKILSHTKNVEYATKKAIENNLKKRNIKAKVKKGLVKNSYKVEYKLVDKPLISIIIPFKDDLKCLDSILKSTYKNYEIICISNNSKKSNIDKIYKYKNEKIKLYEYNKDFNYSEVMNLAVNEYTNGEYIVFLHSRIEIITSEWIEELLMFAQRENIGAVGGKIYNKNNNTIYNAGLIFDENCNVLPIFAKINKFEKGYFNRLKIISNYSIIAPSFMMLKTNLFKEVGGFDENNLKSFYNNLDLNFKIRQKGYFNIWTPFCEAQFTPIKKEQTLNRIENFRKEMEFVKNKYKEKLSKYDEFFSPNLIIDDFNVKIHPLYTNKRSNYLPQSFKENILHSIKCNNKNKKYLAIFIHYDKDNIIDEYVIYYLKELSKYFDILFVSTAEKMEIKEVNKIKKYCRDILIKENYGYDFGAWKSGLNFIGKKIDEYDGLLLCNDSVYGPISSLDEVIKKMKKYDVFSLTDNYEVKYHLQSYFIFYSKKAFMSEIFQSFWNNFKIYIDKRTLIKHYEIEYIRKFFNIDLKIGVFYPSKNKTLLNITHFYWKDLLLNGMPFIKIELLRDNPNNLDISEWKEIINKIGNYPIYLIKNHLKRVKK